MTKPGLSVCPAGVVANADGLNDSQMQLIDKCLGAKMIVLRPNMII